MKKFFIFIFFYTINISNAHHSDAGYDEENIVSFNGVVTEFSWRQPHAYITIETIENGVVVPWEIQMGAPNVLQRRGWNSQSLSIGDEVFFRGNPMIGKQYAKILSIEKSNGDPVATTPGKIVEQQKTNALSGRWIADREMFHLYPGGFDGFFLHFLKLTEKGQEAKDSYNPLSEENPESTCVGRPTPAALVSTWIYLMEIDIREQEEGIIYLRSEWFDEERIIFMDGRKHPNSETFVAGHSIGWWEGETLVVDTRNFDDHRSPYQIGVPSGSKKHVVEKYTLADDGASIEMEFTLEDSEYLAEPFVHQRRLLYAPHMKMLAGECDPETTRRFLSQN
jgi:hypothetical protein|tara:strand:+ start:20805 stop:21815 length:1011 start_codon:yes stop_codon:yes gene_type:complete